MNWISQVVDDKNRKLYEDLNQRYEFSFQLSDENNCGVFIINKTATFRFTEDATSSSFAHELLHVYFDDLGIGIGGCFKLSILSKDRLCEFVSDLLLDEFSNKLEHYKMLSLFIEMGYNKEEFLSDYHSVRLTNKDAKTINKNLKKWCMYNGKMTDVFIGNYLAVLADPKNPNAYSEEIDILKKSDPMLASTIEDMWKKWISYDHTKENGLEQSYRSIIDGFVMNLELWSKNKTFFNKENE